MCLFVFYTFENSKTTIPIKLKTWYSKLFKKMNKRLFHAGGKVADMAKWKELLHKL